MATQLQLRRGSLSDHSSFTGAQGEITVITDDWSLRVHDGLTAGGRTVGASALSALSDVATTGGNAPTNGQALVYDAATQKWKPGSAGGGGGSFQVHRFLSSGIWTKPANLQFVWVFAVSPGSGGGSGSTDYYQGGWGGFGGRIGQGTFQADELPSSVNVVIGAPGVGGVFSAGVPAGTPGTAGGSCSFGDFVYCPTGVPGITPYYSESYFWQNSTRTDDFFPIPEYGGSGGNVYAHSHPGRGPQNQYSQLAGPNNNPVGPAPGGGGATLMTTTWYYGPTTYLQGYYIPSIMHGGEGFAIEKPPILQPSKYDNPNYGWGIPRGRGLMGGIGTDVNPNGYSYDRALADLGGAGALTTQQLAALKRKWKGCGGGGGGVNYSSSLGQFVGGNGGAGSFPGGGGGGGAGNSSGATVGSGGDGGAGVVYVYSFIGSQPFAYA